MLSTHQTLTALSALSPLSLGAPPPPQADSDILAPLGRRTGAGGGASPRGRSRQGTAGSHKIWELSIGPPCQRWIRAAGHSGPDRRALGSLSRSQDLLWARVGGGLGIPPRTTLSRQASAGHLGAPHGSSELDPGVTLHTDPTPHLGGLGPPHPAPAPAPQELARLQFGRRGAGALEGQGAMGSLGWGGFCGRLFQWG